jgi:hypothetical protein
VEKESEEGVGENKALLRGLGSERESIRVKEEAMSLERITESDFAIGVIDDDANVRLVLSGVWVLACFCSGWMLCKLYCTFGAALFFHGGPFRMIDSIMIMAKDIDNTFIRFQFKN